MPVGPPPLARLLGLDRLQDDARDPIVIVAFGNDDDRTLAHLIASIPQATVFHIERWNRNRFSPCSAVKMLRDAASLRKRGAKTIVCTDDRQQLQIVASLVPCELRLVLRDQTLVPLKLGAIVARETQRWLGFAHRLAWRARFLPLSRKLRRPIGVGNDYSFVESLLPAVEGQKPTLRASVIVPVYNRRAILEKTLVGLLQQTYPRELTEIIVADDGSDDAPEEVLERFRDRLNICLVRQEHHGYRLAAVRNLAIRAATGNVILSLDCDMLPEPGWLAGAMRWFHACDANLFVIGYREFVNTDSILPYDILGNFDVVRRLPRVPAPSAVQTPSDLTADWRLQHFGSTRQLKLHPAPYVLASGGNVAFRRSDALRAGLYDEAFNRWGGEDAEFAYRMARLGAYFIPEPLATAYHQDHPPVVSREDDRRYTMTLLGDRVPYFRRHGAPGPHPGPRVSVYIPAYNAATTLQRAIESALNQDERDLEVCICNDGSTDATATLLGQLYHRHPRVRWLTQNNRGIGAASNAAIGLCRGEFILQLDADDELLPRAARRLSSLLARDPNLALVYGSYEIVDATGSRYGYVLQRRHYSSFAHLCGNTVTHPRMFRARDFFRTSGFNETIENAVDYDIGLMLGERGYIKHLPEVLYRYTVHTLNTSVLRSVVQRQNHVRVVNDALRRRGLPWTAYLEDPDDVATMRFRKDVRRE